MLRITHNFKLTSPLHTGGDKSLGILRMLRRERAILPEPLKIRTRFLPEQKKLKRQAIAYLFLKIWDKMENKNRMSIYDEFAGHIISSTAVRTKEDFLNVLCDKLSIRQISSKTDRNFDVFDLLELL